jgi:hypothetical protein
MSTELFTLQENVGAFAVLLGFIGYAFYIRGIIQGTVKPHFFSWFVWAVLTAIACVAQIVAGGGPGAWVTGVTALMSMVFALVGLGSSSRSLIAKSDWVYFIGALLAIVPWLSTGDPLWSVVMITVIDAVAFVPTFRKAYLHPCTENVLTYALSGLKFVFGIVALSSLTLTTALYPASLVVANCAFVAMLLWRRRQLRS